MINLCFTDCGALTAPGNGNVDTTAGTTFGLTATFTCDAGYDLIGDATRECQADGTWSNADPTCQAKGKCQMAFKVYLIGCLVLKMKFNPSRKDVTQRR